MACDALQICIQQFYLLFRLHSDRIQHPICAQSINDHNQVTHNPFGVNIWPELSHYDSIIKFVRQPFPERVVFHSQQAAECGVAEYMPPEADLDLSLEEPVVLEWHSFQHDCTHCRKAFEAS